MRSAAILLIAGATLIFESGSDAATSLISARRPNGVSTQLPLETLVFHSGDGGSNKAISIYGLAVLMHDSRAERPNNLLGGPINFTFSGGSKATPTPGSSGSN